MFAGTKFVGSPSSLLIPFLMEVTQHSLCIVCAKWCVLGAMDTPTSEYMSPQQRVRSREERRNEKNKREQARRSEFAALLRQLANLLKVARYRTAILMRTSTVQCCYH